MLGKPKYKRNDRVRFEVNNKIYEGSVYIVDAYGTFEYTKDVSYDIMVDAGSSGERALFKHIPERYVCAVED